QDVLSEEDLTALQAVLAQRDYQIVIDLPQPEIHDRVRRAVGRRLLADESTTPAPEAEEKIWPPLPRSTRVDAGLDKAVRERFPPASRVNASVAAIGLDMSDEQIYTSGNYNYLFVAGNYRYIDVYANSLEGVSAWLYATTSLIVENNPSLPIFFKYDSHKWFLDLPPEESLPAAVTTLPEVKGKPEVTSASPSLVQLAQSWGAGNTFQYNQMAVGHEGAIYQDDKFYICLQGKYWPFIFVSDSVGVIITGAKYVYVLRKENTWDTATTIRPMVMPGVSVVSRDIDERIEKEFDPRNAMQPSPGDFKTQKERGIYESASGETFIYAATNFWPVTLTKTTASSTVYDNATIYEKRNDSTAKTVNIFKDRQSQQWGDKDQTPTTGTGKRPENTTASAWLTEEARLWSYDTRTAGFPASLEGDGGIYRQPNGDLYIFLNKAWWPFVFLGGNVGVISVKKKDETVNVIVHNYKGMWEYAGETAVEAPQVISDAISSLLINTDLAREIRHALFHALSGHDYVSWNTLLQLLLQIIDQEFYRLYTEPDNEKLRKLLILKNKLVRRQQQMHYTEQLLPAAKKNEWNEPLLNTYYHAFSTGLVDTTEIYAAWHSRLVVQDIKKKKKLLESYNVDLKIAEVSRKIAEADNRRQIHMRNIKEQFNAPDGNKEITRAKEEQEKIKILESEKKQLQKIADNIREKTTQYDKQIQLHSEKYSGYDQGVILAKNTLGTNLRHTTDQNSTSLATEEAIITLALQEVKMLVKEREAYSEKELHELKTIRIARDLVIRMSEQQSIFNSLVNRLTAIGIEKHSLANDYTDIVWVNEQAEKINKNNFQFNENTEDSFFLAPILYWLLKNNKKISNLQGQDITKIVDDYYTDVYHLNPLTEITKIPEGYTSLSGVLSSEYFENQSDYNEQFRVYKEKYSTYDASELAKTLLLFSGVSLADLLKKTKKRLRFEVKVTDTDANRMPGEMLFIQLHDNRWIFFSLFPGAMFSRVFSANQMNANVFLNEITKINPDAKFSFDEYLELYSNTFLKQYGGMGIGLFRERWEITKKNLIKAFLYNSDNGIEYPSPFSENSDYGIIYHRNINATQPGNNVISLLNTSIRAVLNNSAEVKRRELYTPFILQKIAFVMIPFYREIYHYATNEEYEVDMESVLLDTIGVVFIAVSAGVQIASVISRMKGISTFLQQGLKNGLAGKSLQLYVLKEMAKDAAFSALKITKISMMALIDMIDPLAIKEITRFTIHRISKTKNLRVLVPEDVPIAQTRGINKKYARTDVDIWKMYKSKVKDAEVYVPSTINNQNKEYYISVDDNTYQIRWDDASYTWRTVDPKNPGRFAYGEPIVFENGKWKINIAYGGLRGGGKRASSRDDVVMGIQQMREDLKKEKVLENLNGGNEFDAQEYLTKMREVGEISQSINYPKEKCEYVSSYVAAYLARNGFEEIRYRAMAFFIHGTDRKPVNHYVIVARRGEKGGDYVFDLTAAQFGGIYAELNGPIILPEALWAQKYANLTSRSLIKYGDYPTRAAATTDFGPFSKYFFYGPNSLIPNAKVLLRPSWYYPATQVADTVAGTQKKMPVIGLGFSNPVREAARRSRLTDVVSDVSWDYAVDLLENAELLSRGPGDALRKGLKQATGEPEFVNVKSLFARTQTVDSMESLLRVRQGDVLLFTATDPALSAMEARPVHIMVSLGNGRFAGVKNNVLDPALGEGKQIITAEQLGEFTGTTFRRRGGDTRDIHLIAAEPKEIIREESLTLKTLAEQATETVADAQAVLTKSTDLLRQSGELAPEQALALQAILTPLFKSGTQQAGTEINRSVKQFFVTPQKVPNSTALGALPKGKLVIFGDSGADSFSAHHLMYSLGEGEFMMVNPARLDPRLTSNNAVVKASQFPEELFSKYGVQAGDISLTNLRLTSLLGRDARFFAEGPILTVRLHGAASNVNYMDAYELSEVIKGLALRETPPLNLGSIREIKLESCYGAFGLVPTGKALAYLLDKKVVAYPLRFSARIHNNPSVFNRFRTYVPADLSPAERTKIINQSSRNHDFWNRLLGLYKSVKTTRTRREADLFTDLINNVADFVNGVFDERVFLDEYPEYQSGLYVTLEQFRALCSDEINSAEAFAERCMDILTLSAFSADLLDKYLGGTGSVS
ncbi:Dermonecrotoxin of the Papain-like fold, partial [Kosakonia oryzendophytica]